MATEENIKSYLDMSDPDDYAEYNHYVVEVAFDDICPIPPIRTTLEVGKGVSFDDITKNGYVQEYIQELVDKYRSMLADHITVRITDDAKTITRVEYPYGPARYTDYCKDCAHAEMSPDGRFCYLKEQGGSPTAFRQGDPDLIEACALFKRKEV